MSGALGPPRLTTSVGRTHDMALDLAILGDDGAPSEFVGIGVNEHWELLQRASPTGSFPLIQRLADYYEDVSFTPSEVAALKAELTRIGCRGMEGKIASLVALLERAGLAGRGVEAIAD